MAKPPVVYPVSADLSAILGAAVDVDAAWAIDQPIDPGAIEANFAARLFALIGSAAKARAELMGLLGGE